ncbi:MAG: S-layer homology domain-containing protein [Epulopiscium sp.]|nr:S-layer homology domain-containing protein [Candidatus Epulonipiscium sp.]
MKKIKSLLLVMVLLVGLLIVPIQGATSQQDDAANQLKTLGLLQGYPDGTLGLDRPINRVEMTVLLIRLLGYESNIVIGAENHQFKDINGNYWGQPWIQKAAALALMKGFPDQTFRPEQSITYAEAVALMVRLMKKEDNLVGDWPMNYMNRGREIGILPPGLNKEPNQHLTRGEVSEIIWNTLLTKIK